MSNKVVLIFDEDDNNPRFSIRPKVSENMPEDNTLVLIDPALAERQGIALDSHGFPTSESLEAWHRKNNPHLFTD